MWSNPLETADLVTFTEEILNGKLHFLCIKNSVFFKDHLLTDPIIPSNIPPHQGKRGELKCHFKLQGKMNDWVSHKTQEEWERDRKLYKQT